MIAEKNLMSVSFNTDSCGIFFLAIMDIHIWNLYMRFLYIFWLEKYIGKFKDVWIAEYKFFANIDLGMREYIKMQLEPVSLKS